MNDFQTLTDHQGRIIRLTDERWAHIIEHPEMVGERTRLVETISAPEIVIATAQDESIHTYHRFYENTPVTRKYMLVAVKILNDDAFVVTAFYTSRQKRGKIVWLP